MSTNFSRYKRAVLDALVRTKNIESGILSEDDMRHLPSAIRKFISLTGSVGREKILNFRAEFTGGIRSASTDEYMPLRSVQYNFTDKPTRLFYISARKKGVPVTGIHVYKDRTAIMVIKILGLFRVVNAKGREMDQGETVTLFNDMCFMAPASLIDRNIEWKEIDNKTVEARYTNGGITIRAVLYFNDKGELINFVSNDRFETTDGKVYMNYPWSTPVTAYKKINGYYLPSSAKMIYSHPDEEFCYGEFNLVSMEYNCREFK